MTELTDHMLRTLNGQAPDAPITPKPTDIPAENARSIPLVSDTALRLAREAASALDKIDDGWPELTSTGFHSWLRDGAESLRDLADAVEQMQKALQ